jgi:7-cyano-7-deazaguanine synthase
MTAYGADRGLLLFSGGLDSTALAALYRPAGTLFIDYGQRPAIAEGRAAAVIADSLGLSLHTMRLDLRPIGGGLLHGDDPIEEAPSPEWWPFRNQMLVTAAAVVALREGLQDVMVGTVLGDGDRHVDGTPEFYEVLDRLFRIQEGGIGVSTPGIDRSTEELVAESGLGADILGWTVSCHRSNLPCGDCPGCWKRARALRSVGLQP